MNLNKMMRQKSGWIYLLIRRTYENNDFNFNMEGGSTMTPLFDKNCYLVGWMSDDRDNIFDCDMNWVAYINGGNIWSASTDNWLGVAYGLNARDTQGKTVFWNPDQPIENTLVPLRPLKPIKPIQPLRPLSPLIPLRPLRPLTPLGGWSNLGWNSFLNQ